MIGSTPQLVVVPGPSPRALPLSPRWISETSSALMREFSGNLWFLDSYWPENKARALRILEAGLKKFPAIDGARVLDVACGNGYMSFLFARAGFRVNATDGDSMPERDRMFQTEGIGFFSSNLNEVEPFREIPSDHYSIIVMGEIFEHILNHPVGLLREARRILRPGGCLILTTPNPSTLQNAVRLVRGKSPLWGTKEFLELPKVHEGRIISYGGIHYREYTFQEMRFALEESGFEIKDSRFLGMGSAKTQPLWKRVIKSSRLTKWMMGSSLFGCTQWHLAVKKG